MVWEIFELKTSDSWKTAFQIALEDPQENIAKKYKKTMKLSGFFSNFPGLNYPSYQLFEATFLQLVFPKL